MPKTKLDNILKNGSKFKMREIDIDDLEFDEMTTAIEEETNRAKARKKNRPNRTRYKNMD